MSFAAVLFGALLVISGIVSIFNPISSAVSLGIFLGVFIGILFILGGIGGLKSQKYLGSSVLNTVFNVMMIILGIMIICTGTGALQASNVIIIIMAIDMLIAGICRILLAVEVKRMGSSYTWIMLSGILSVLAAIVIMINPLTGLMVIDVMLSIIVIIQGFSLITLGLKY